jgi:membrane protein implicated in regulation of membrane protease activity
MVEYLIGIGMACVFIGLILTLIFNKPLLLIVSLISVITLFILNVLLDKMKNRKEKIDGKN